MTQRPQDVFHGSNSCQLPTTNVLPQARYGKVRVYSCGRTATIGSKMSGNGKDWQLEINRDKAENIMSIIQRDSEP